ncbi:DUF397 domain-containing protein [Actinomadura gamaensis]|uniref:DUF397 domain-containing protein n=1 Tax=Actinomadura gamaensis TaxID=1763541 RepID=A0ABV9TWV8_9ACTN
MTAWRKSSHSGTDPESDCVEVAASSVHVAVRDSKEPEGPRLRVGASEWGALLASIKLRRS